MFQRSFNQALALLKETHRVDNFIPKDYYRTLKLVSKLSLSAKKKKIDCFVDGCMLFYTDEDRQLIEFKFCHKPRYKARWVGVNIKMSLWRECIIYPSFLVLRDYMPK